MGLADADALALDLLQILEPAQHLVLHPELRLHAELGPLLDAEGFLFQLLHAARRGQVDDDVVAALDLEREGGDDAFAFVRGVDGERLATAET